MLCTTHIITKQINSPVDVTKRSSFSNVTIIISNQDIEYGEIKSKH